MSPQMAVYMLSLINSVNIHIYTLHNNPVCVCVYVRKPPESSSLVVLSTRQYRLLLTLKYESTRELDSWICTHTHTGLLCIYVYRINQ